MLGIFYFSSKLEITVSLKHSLVSGNSGARVPNSAVNVSFSRVRSWVNALCIEIESDAMDNIVCQIFCHIKERDGPLLAGSVIVSPAPIAMPSLMHPDSVSVQSCKLIVAD